MPATHNLSRSKEYRCWVRMIHRCHDEDYAGYENYGARGIEVCPRWRSSFECFLVDMGKAPSPAHSIERADNDKGYCKANCRWATWKEQGNNRRTSVWIEFRGLKMTMVQWAEFLGVSRKLLWKRFKLAQEHPERWPLDKILTPWPEQLHESPALAA